MSERYRFRHLVQRGPDASTRPWSQDDPLLAHRREMPPMAVEAQDGEGTLEEIAALLKEGRLYRDDLVDLGRGWELISDTPELGELAEHIPARPSMSPRARLYFTLAVATLVAELAALFIRARWFYTIVFIGVAVMVVGPPVMMFVGLFRPGRKTPSLASKPFDPKRKD